MTEVIYKAQDRIQLSLPDELAKPASEARLLVPEAMQSIPKPVPPMNNFIAEAIRKVRAERKAAKIFYSYFQNIMKFQDWKVTLRSRLKCVGGVPRNRKKIHRICKGCTDQQFQRTEEHYRNPTTAIKHMRDGIVRWRGWSFQNWTC